MGRIVRISSKKKIKMSNLVLLSLLGQAIGSLWVPKFLAAGLYVCGVRSPTQGLVYANESFTTKLYSS